jgi:hypothetical protein
MPERTARLLDVRTSPVRERIAAIDEFRRAAYYYGVTRGLILLGCTE